MTKKIRILLVDDHAIVRLGLTTLLNDQPDMEVIGEASAAGEAVKAVEALQPDVTLMDIRLPGEGGIEATRQITKKFPSSKVVMLTSFADDELVALAIRAGAVGYVLKQVETDDLLRAIQAAARGESVLDPATTARLLLRVREAERKADEDAFRDLTNREMDVLVPLARGKTNAEIASLLNLSEKTVGNYIGAMFEKLHLNNRIELAAYAYEHHLFEKMGKE
ncbi:MAG: response regulator transcription factor [Chloroflexi bacterium]|nr:response regulator transcription factor [Chloroflexota bacterium]